MKQSPFLVFGSPIFAVEPGEDEATNPGVYGKALAEWLSARLRETGVPCGDVIAEDFGWLVSVESKPHALYVVCTNYDGRTDAWRLFIFAEGGLLARLLGRDERASQVEALYARVREVLDAEAGIADLREETA